MKDTPDYIIKEQIRIFLSMPLKERFILNMELTEFVREMARKRILNQFSGISEKELKAKLFRQFYDAEFISEELEEICKILANR